MNSGPASFSAKQLDRLPPSDLVVIATPDDTIAETANVIAASQKERAFGRTVLHTSGALSAAVLSPLAAVGFHVGSMHPLVSVTDPQAGSASLRRAFYCLEGDRTALKVARSVVHDLGGQSFSIAARDKALYHAAAVTASGHVVALFDIALEMLGRCGLSSLRARQVLLPLIESTVSNLSFKTPAESLTGTFARGDLATVRKHLDAIKNEHLSTALAAYVLLGGRSLALAKEKGAATPEFDQIADILRSIEKKKN